MNIVKTRRQLALDLAHERGKSVVDQFRSAIRPIYRRDPTHAYTQVGTCTFVRINGVEVMVTAAHIIDQHKEQLWVGNESILVPLIGDFHQTDAPAGDRNLDQFDFAACVVGVEFRTSLAGITFIDQAVIGKGRRADRNGDIYSCLGYPNSKNKKKNVTKREIDVQLWMHTGPGASKTDKLGEWGKDTSAHLFIEFPKYPTTATGERRNTTEPRGSSGGPVFYDGNINEANAYNQELVFQPRLEAIIIKKPTNAGLLVAVKLGAIIDACSMRGIIPKHSDS